MKMDIDACGSILYFANYLDLRRRGHLHYFLNKKKSARIPLCHPFDFNEGNFPNILSEAFFMLNRFASFG